MSSEKRPTHSQEWEDGWNAGYRTAKELRERAVAAEQHFTQATELLVVAMKDAIATWPAEGSGPTAHVGKVSPAFRRALNERHGYDFREMRQLWRQIDYRLKGGEPASDDVTESTAGASVVEANSSE